MFLFFIQDEDIYTFFEPELPAPSPSISRVNSPSPVNGLVPHPSANKGGSNISCSSLKHPFSAPDKKPCSNGNGNGTGWWSALREKITVHEGSSVLDLKSENYFSFTVGRKRSSARYLLNSSADVASLLDELAESLQS